MDYNKIFSWVPEDREPERFQLHYWGKGKPTRTEIEECVISKLFSPIIYENDPQGMVVPVDYSERKKTHIVEFLGYHLTRFEGSAGDFAHAIRFLISRSTETEKARGVFKHHFDACKKDIEQWLSHIENSPGRGLYSGLDSKQLARLHERMKGAGYIKCRKGDFIKAFTPGPLPPAPLFKRIKWIHKERQGRTNRATLRAFMEATIDGQSVRQSDVDLLFSDNRGQPIQLTKRKVDKYHNNNLDTFKGFIALAKGNKL